MKRSPVIIAAVVALLAVGCGGSDTDDTTADPSTTSSTVSSPTTSGPGTTADGSTPSTSAPTDADTTRPIGAFSLDPQRSDGFLSTGQPVALLVAINQASHSGFQRIVLEFSGGTTPQYEVRYIPPPMVQPGSGNPVDLEGSAVLRIQAEPASRVDLSQQDLIVTYDGPDRITLQGPGPAIELVLAGDFEANLHLAAGVRREAPFAVGTLTNPTRLVIDIAN
jgi:hypothetical protein